MSSWTNPDDLEIPDEFVRIGHVTRAHGIRGAVVVKFYTDSPEQFAPGLSVRMHPSEMVLTLASSQPVRDGFLASFSEVTDRNTSEGLRGQQLLMERSKQRPLDEDEFWPSDLVGMAVVDSEGNSLGTVASVQLGEAQDRLEINNGGASVLVPFVAELVPEIRMDDRIVVIQPVPGLLVESAIEEE